MAASWPTGACRRHCAQGCNLQERGRGILVEAGALATVRDAGDMPKKRGDRAHRMVGKRARRQRRQLAEEERVREDHARLVVERSQDPRFVQRIHGQDGSTVYRWSTDSVQHEQLREMLEGQVRRFRDKFGRDPSPEDPIFFDPDADEPRLLDLDTVTREMTEGLRRAGRETGVDLR